jgi:hypothetical protein
MLRTLLHDFRSAEQAWLHMLQLQPELVIHRHMTFLPCTNGCRSEVQSYDSSPAPHRVMYCGAPPAAQASLRMYCATREPGIASLEQRAPKARAYSHHLQAGSTCAYLVNMLTSAQDNARNNAAMIIVESNGLDAALTINAIKLVTM